jgi:hypothetical protein
MRKFFMVGAAAASLLITAASAVPPAQAMTLAVPAGISQAIHETNLAEDVAYVCSRRWRRSVCWWTPGPFVYYRPYSYYSYSYYRPYRRGWWW